jgi:hypothetical protein
VLVVAAIVAAAPGRRPLERVEPSNLKVAALPILREPGIDVVIPGRGRLDLIHQRQRGVVDLQRRRFDLGVVELAELLLNESNNGPIVPVRHRRFLSRPAPVERPVPLGNVDDDALRRFLSQRPGGPLQTS